MLIRVARAVITFTTLAAFYGCSGGVAGRDTPLKPQQPLWAMYQHSADRNAVFERYSAPRTWSYDAAAKINSGLALVGTTVLFTTFSRKLIALDVRDGDELWHANVPHIAMSTPIVAGNSVYIGTGRNGDIDRTLHTHFTLRNLLLRLRFGKEEIWGVPDGDEIAAFDLRTGALRWIHRTVGEDMPSAVYDHGRLVYANGDSHAYALRADTGKQIWSTDLGGIATMASAVLVKSTVVVGTCGKGDVVNETIALDTSTGKILWRAPYGHCDSAPAYADRKVFVASVVTQSELQKRTRVAALDAQTGKPLWVYRGSVGFMTLAGSNEEAIAGTYASGMYYQAEPFTNDIVSFDASTGKVRWRFHTSAPVKMSPVIMNGRLYVGDTVGLLYTLNARNGALLELRAFKKPFTTSPPIIAGNKLIIANSTSVQAIPLSGVSPKNAYVDDTYGSALVFKRSSP